VLKGREIQFFVEVKGGETSYLSLENFGFITKLVRVKGENEVFIEEEQTWPWP